MYRQCLEREVLPEYHHSYLGTEYDDPSGELVVPFLSEGPFRLCCVTVARPCRPGGGGGPPMRLPFSAPKDRRPGRPGPMGRRSEGLAFALLLCPQARELSATSYMHPPPECNNPYGRHLRAHPLLEVLSPPSAGTRVSDCRERCCLRAVRPPEWPDPPRSAEVGLECHLPGGGGVATPSKRDGHVHMWVGGTAWRRNQSERAGEPQMASRTMDEKPLRAWSYLCSPRCPHGARSNR